MRSDHQENAAGLHLIRILPRTPVCLLIRASVSQRSMGLGLIGQGKVPEPTCNPPLHSMMSEVIMRAWGCYSRRPRCE